MEKLFEDISREGTAKFDIVDFFKDYYLVYLNNIAKHAKEWIGDFFGTDKFSFDNLEIVYRPSGGIDDYIKRLISAPIVYTPKIGVNLDDTGKVDEEGLLNAVKDKDSQYIFFLTRGGKIGEKLPPQVIRSYIAEQVFPLINKSIFNFVQYFPADRTGLISLMAGIKVGKPKPAKVNENSEEDEDKKSLPAPVGGMIALFVKIKNKTVISKREQEINSDHLLRRYYDLADILQHKILGGELELSKKDSGEIDDIIFKYGEETKIELDIPISSSAVKDLTQLVMYLKYIAKPNDLLIIDEPEMNLHPEAQIKLMEFLAILVNSQLNLIITTHSPYIVDQLANLIKADKSNKKDDIKDKFLLKNSDAFISQEKVSIYLFGEIGESSVQDILRPDGRIKWGTFSRVSEYTSRLYHEI